ncbi:hypothetical protein CBR_g49779 [Chara braunii]|uniref:Expansin n=1 Tax=Chara braunii TaxID=69332 RepID=A0A388M626_CHABU|nr:hypothetical protein CBR_g49779 [Chara braunii]|eukprot:GBG89929.1 hypothetical protein CBR_g49779 [Chara braunii]
MAALCSLRSMFAVLCGLLLLYPASAGDYTTWSTGRATFYGAPDGSGLDGGNCGFGPLANSYGRYVAAISISLYQNGKGCGGCYEVKCVDSQWCTGKSVIISATDQCPDGGYCDNNQAHFDMSHPAFEMIAQKIAGVIPVSWRRVPCVRTGPIQFVINGNPFWFTIMPKNVAGAGDVKSVEVQIGGRWVPMIQLWGQNWLLSGMGQVNGAISVRVTTLLTGEVITVPNVIPSGWKSGTPYTSGMVNFACSAVQTVTNTVRRVRKTQWFVTATNSTS